jgi:hypothetical protein
MGVAVGVKMEVGMTGAMGDGVSVEIKIKAGVANGVGVGSGVREKLQPVNSMHPTNQSGVSLLFIAFSSQKTLTIISLVL